MTLTGRSAARRAGRRGVVWRVVAVVGAVAVGVAVAVDDDDDDDDDDGILGGIPAIVLASRGGGTNGRRGGPVAVVMCAGGGRVVATFDAVVVDVCDATTFDACTFAEDAEATWDLNSLSFSVEAVMSASRWRSALEISGFVVLGRVAMLLAGVGVDVVVEGFEGAVVVVDVVDAPGTGGGRRSSRGRPAAGVMAVVLAVVAVLVGGCGCCDIPLTRWMVVERRKE